MQRTVLFCAFTGTLLLTACGGSGAHKPQPQDNAAVSHFNQQHIAHGDRVPQSVGYTASVQAQDQGDADAGIDAVDQLRIDGKSYAIAVPVDNSAAYYNYLDNGDYTSVSSGRFLSYSRFAVLKIRGYASDAFIALGEDTAAEAMPQRGDATYRGRGLHQTTNRGTLIPTNVNASIDFAAKRAAIAINGDNLALDLTGRISGNKVRGEDGLQAAFYGPQAKELAGNYAKSGNGVFGAVRQNGTE